MLKMRDRPKAVHPIASVLSKEEDGMSLVFPSVSIIVMVSVVVITSVATVRLTKNEFIFTQIHNLNDTSSEE